MVHQDDPTATPLLAPVNVEDGVVAPLSATERVTRGVCRYFDSLGAGVLTEFTLRGGRRADVIALSADGGFTIVEVKTSLADFRADAKWPEYREFCDRFYFAVDEDFPRDVLPPDAGLIIADAFDAAVLREPPRHKLHASRRKAVTLRFALIASTRLRRPAQVSPRDWREGVRDI